MKTQVEIWLNLKIYICNFFKWVQGRIAIRNLKINPKCSLLINYSLGLQYLGEGNIGYFSSCCRILLMSLRTTRNFLEILDNLLYTATGKTGGRASAYSFYLMASTHVETHLDTYKLGHWQQWYFYIKTGRAHVHLVQGSVLFYQGPSSPHWVAVEAEQSTPHSERLRCFYMV